MLKPKETLATFMLYFKKASQSNNWSYLESLIKPSST